MGVLPLQFREGEGAAALGLTGRESFELTGISDGLAPRAELQVRATAPDGATTTFLTTVRIDTPEELTYYHHGGILPYVLRTLAKG
jgi:aconitate hydratase